MADVLIFVVMKMNLFTAVFMCVFGGTFCAPLAYVWAEEEPALDAALLLGDPEKGVIMESRSYHFMVRPYNEPIVVPHKENQRARALNTAENAAIVHFNAMIKGDYGLWLSAWDDISKQEMIKDHYATGRDADFWKKWWRKGFLGYNNFHLVRRVDSGEYVIIEMKAEGQGMKDLYLDVPLKKVAPLQWRATDELKKDPVFEHWRKGQYTVNAVAR